MCLGKPKIPKAAKADKPKDPAIIRNRYLDGIDPTFRALRLGRSALRIERAGVAGAPASPPVTAPAPRPTTPSAPIGGGGGIGGGGIGRIVRPHLV
jgi:hypothetical protein